MRPIGVAVVGAGYWGPNLVRNLQACDEVRLLHVCDLDTGRARAAVGAYSSVRVTESLDDVLSDDRVEAVAVATPAATHVSVVLAALETGKHVLVEKPLALSVAEGEKLVHAAAQQDVVLMCDHTYCYTPAVLKLRELIRGGEVGDVQYFDSVRVNLGIVQSDIDVFWDLAPHDLSILDFVLPDGSFPAEVAAQAADPIGAGHPCVGYLAMPLPGGGIAHVHVNWLSPVKVRTTIVGGSRRMVVWDDVDPSQRLRMYDRGIDMPAAQQAESRRETLISYRVGDMIAPALPEVEALDGVVHEFASAINQHRRPLTDGEAGLRVMRTLEAASLSLERGGAAVRIET